MKFYTNSLQEKHIPISKLEIANRLKDILPFLDSIGKLTRVETNTYQGLIEGLPEEEQKYVAEMITKVVNTQFQKCKKCSIYNLLNEVPRHCYKCNFRYFNDVMNETSIHPETGSILENMLSCVSTALSDNIKKQQLIEDVMLVTRPPGHHSSDDIVSGFCYINWTYIISQYLRNLTKGNRVCIVDLDLHHGNGTEIMVKNKNNTLFMDFHYYDGGFYPGTGNEFEYVAENIINVNMPKDSKDDVYVSRFMKELPKLTDFNPDFFVLSMGCDIVDGDDFDIMRCSPQLYKKIYDILKEEFGKKMIIVLEGGYNTDNVTNTIKAFVTE
jgi:acetoin utilization deacetylase AcuC-like enzyme